MRNIFSHIAESHMTSLQSQIWAPTLGFTNAKSIGGTKVDVVASTVVQRVGEPAPDDIQRALEANVYKGEESYIIMKREYFIDWTCEYDLLYYPFDTQVQKLTVQYTVTGYCHFGSHLLRNVVPGL